MKQKVKTYIYKKEEIEFENLKPGDIFSMEGESGLIDEKELLLCDSLPSKFKDAEDEDWEFEVKVSKTGRLP